MCPWCLTVPSVEEVLALECSVWPLHVFLASLLVIPLWLYWDLIVWLLWLCGDELGSVLWVFVLLLVPRLSRLALLCSSHGPAFHCHWCCPPCTQSTWYGVFGLFVCFFPPKFVFFLGVLDPVMTVHDVSFAPPSVLGCELLKERAFWLVFWSLNSAQKYSIKKQR